MAIRVAYHTITWGQQNFLQALDEIAALGFQGFETFAGVADQFGDRVSEFKDLLAQRGLRLVTVYGIGRVCHIAFWDANGAGRLVLGGGSRRSAKPSLDDLRNQAHCMNEIGRRCLDLGVLACYHPHYATTVETPDEIDWMMEHTDPRYVFLGPDTAHLRKGKGDEVAIIRTYAERVRYVHFKDWDPNAFQQAQQARATGAEAATAILPDFVELGTGVVKVKECFQVLKDRGYDGWITIELDRSRTTPKDSATKNKLFVEKELGLKVG